MVTFASEHRAAFRKLVAANHILHHHGAVDGFGHVSIRHPGDATKFVMSGYMAPALVSGLDDLVEYHVDGSGPVAPDDEARRGYAERFIHGELYRRFPDDVHCVIHSHAEAVVPYAVGPAPPPLFPVFHMAGFLGGGPVKVWDIAPLYADAEGEPQDMLVRNTRLGASLADSFAAAENPGAEEDSQAGPESTVVLMRSHGFTTCGATIENTVYRAIYTVVNAGIQTRATLLGAATGSGPVTPLPARQARDARAMNEGNLEKCWNLWVREVGVNPLYSNSV